MVVRNNEGEATFNVTKITDRAWTTRFDLVCDETVRPWLTIVGKSERSLGKTADQVLVRLKAPPDAEGQFSCKVRAVPLPPLGRSDEACDSQPVAFTLTKAPVVAGGGTKVPWWVFVIIGVVVLGIVGTVLYFVFRDKGLPDLVGRPVAEAQQILEDRKLKAVTKPERSAEPEGTVLRQDPAPGAKLEENDQVTLVISARAPVGIPVPNLVGLTLADATARAKAAGLNLNSAGSPTSIVVSQDPRPNPGLRVAPGTPITVVVKP
jgi:hypothetical protein